MNPVDMAAPEEQAAATGPSELLMLSAGSSPENSDEEDEEVAPNAPSINGQDREDDDEDDDEDEGEGEGDSSVASSCNYRRGETSRPQSRHHPLGQPMAQKGPQEVAATSEQFVNNQQISHHHMNLQQHHQHNHRHHQHLQQHQQKDYEDVKQVELFGASIVALTINGKERLCLAQISNTLLKEFSYNEIHNRRVALGITCVQCTPIQLEMLRRAGAMPSSSRRCGMITMREAERLCRSFLVEEQPPELPENFYFTVAHRVNYGCKGRFVPARYISSRAKCIECFYCGEFYSPNKFIFHSHRQPHTTDCNPPDSPNINSWRKHIDLDWSQEHGQEIKYAWEDVKSLFNGGTRRRAPQNALAPSVEATTAGQLPLVATSGPPKHQGHRHHHHHQQQQPQQHSSSQQATNNQRGREIKPEEDQLIVDVDDSINNKAYVKPEVSQPKRSNSGSNKAWLQSSGGGDGGSRSGASSKRQPGNSLMLNSETSRSSSEVRNCLVGPQKRGFNTISPQQQQAPCNKRYSSSACNTIQASDELTGGDTIKHSMGFAQDRGFQTPASPACSLQPTGRAAAMMAAQQSLPFVDFMNSLPASSGARCPIQSNESQTNNNNNQSNQQASNKQIGLLCQNSPSFIYSQLYTRLMQQQPASQQQQQQQQTSQQQLTSAVDAQIALRHHLWSSLLANLQCNTGNQTYSLQQHHQQQSSGLGLSLGVDATDLPSANISHLLANPLYQPQQVNNGPKLAQNSHTSLEQHGYKTNAQSAPFSMHKSFPAETSDL